MPKRDQSNNFDERRFISSATSLLAVKDALKEGKADEAKYRKDVLEQLKIAPTVENGNHSEITLPSDDGGSIFVQLQRAEKLTHVDNIVPELRKMLGEKAETFIIKTETLLPDALENMVSMGLLSSEQAQDLVHKKTTERLIVKHKKR